MERKKQCLKHRRINMLKDKLENLIQKTKEELSKEEFDAYFA